MVILAFMTNKIRLLKNRWLRVREMRAIRIRRSYIEINRKKEKRKSGLRSLKELKKIRAQFIYYLPAIIPSNLFTER
jgi:hypothetical protein